MIPEYTAPGNGCEYGNHQNGQFITGKGKGDYISYGGHGVCQIADVRSMDFGSGEQEYLVIEPIASGGATIYLPSSNQTVQTRMRPVLTREEIDVIISSVKL